MPSIDFTEALLDPELSDEFRVIRRMGGNDKTGVNRLRVISRKVARGTVRPAGSSALERVPDYQTMGKSLEVTTTFRLRGPAKQGKVSVPPDLVEWPVNSGDMFVIVDLQDWTRVGRGFVVAVCSSQRFIDEAPGVSDIVHTDTVSPPALDDEIELP
jgi:hypothetical protein